MYLGGAKLTLRFYWEIMSKFYWVTTDATNLQTGKTVTANPVAITSSILYLYIDTNDYNNKIIKTMVKTNKFKVMIPYVWISRINQSRLQQNPFAIYSDAFEKYLSRIIWTTYTGSH